MSGRIIQKDSANQSTIVRIVDSTDGTPETGVVAATAGLALDYRREGAVVTSITPLSDLLGLANAHLDGALLHIGDGYYRIDVPDSAFATGADGVIITGTATGMIVIGTYHTLVDNYDIGVVDIRTEMDTNSTQLAAIVADSNELQADWVNGGRLDLILDAIAADTTTNIPALIAALNDPSFTELVTTALAESYAADGVAPSIAQLLFEVRALLAEPQLSGVTLTTKQLDGVTPAATYTVDDAVNPTSLTRST